MKQLVQAQIEVLLEGARLLETQPDVDPSIRGGLASARESLSRYRSKTQADIVRSVSGAVPAPLALDVVNSMRASIDNLTSVSGCGNGLPDQATISRVRETLESAYSQLCTKVRAPLADRLRGIYVVVDPEATRDRPVAEVAAQALQGGAKVVQLRDKLDDKGPMLESAQELKSMCAAHGALFVMNDHADLARAAEADVLHVGQTDLPVSGARQILRPHQLIGNSNGTMEEVLRSLDDAVDYIAVGAIYATTTMGKSGRRALGPEIIERVKEAVTQPIVAIGGINRNNIVDVVKAGADSVCVVSAITLADDPRAATEELVELYESAAS